MSVERGILVIDTDTDRAWVHGPCFVCNDVMTYNPNKVPSLPAEVTGTHRQPLCRKCALKARDSMIARGLPGFTIAIDAYEAIPVEELPPR